MIAKASVTFIRISPRKVRYVIDLIRAKSVRQAQAILNGSPRRGSDIIRKLLDQAVDAAEKNSQVHANDLVISKVTADGGPTMKRFRAASMGRAGVIRKRTSHIHLELDLAKSRQGVTPVKPAAKPSAESKKPAAAQGAKKTAAAKKPAKKLVGAK